MKLQTVIGQMEEFIQDFRAQLHKKDPDSVATLTTNVKKFFARLEGELPANADFGPQFESIVACTERFGDACSNNDMQEAAKALSEMEMTVKSLERQCPATATA